MKRHRFLRTHEPYHSSCKICTLHIHPSVALQSAFSVSKTTWGLSVWKYTNKKLTKSPELCNVPAFLLHHGVLGTATTLPRRTTEIFDIWTSAEVRWLTQGITTLTSAGVAPLSCVKLGTMRWHFLISNLSGAYWRHASNLLQILKNHRDRSWFCARAILPIESLSAAFKIIGTSIYTRSQVPMATWYSSGAKQTMSCNQGT